jgi:carboxypeptidase T
VIDLSFSCNTPEKKMSGSFRVVSTHIGMLTRRIVCSIVFTFTFAGAAEQFSEVRIFATSSSDFKRIEDTGLIIDHANTKLGYYSDAWLSQPEIQLLKKSGVSYQILIEDWDSYYARLPKMTQSEMEGAIRASAEQYNVSHSIYGSMGGFLTYAEVVAKLDSMRLQYPNYISAKFSIGTTIEARTMWAARITKNPDAPTGRPEALYHALIHAREPESMETQMYYFYWLFENYGIDPLATYILNNREIYWVPVFNPDGYVYNQTTNPGGGGMWRSNRHSTGGNCGYVDPNRNFGIYQFWNSSNGGSSTDPCSGGQGTYRGTSPFSEPETQHIMNFVNSRNFNAAFGAHTYGNYLIKPWAWSDPSPTPDDNKFNQFLADMKASNPVYTTGTPSQTVGYFVRGGADDWYYNDSAHTGHHIFAITPETGSTGFWPTQAEIIPLAQGMLFNNQYMSLIAGPFVNPTSRAFDQSTYTAGESGVYGVWFRNKGALTAYNVSVTWTSPSPSITIPTTQFIYPSVGSFDTNHSIFDFTISTAVANNSAIPAQLTVRMDTATVYSAVVYVLIGTGVLILDDNASTFTNWTRSPGGTWAVTTAQSYSPPSSFTDSPGGNYGNNVDNSMILALPINATLTPALSLSFNHKYATEAGYDFCILEASSDNGTTWQPVANYSGTLSTWTQQTFDLSSYANSSAQFKIRFRLTSDANITADGWYVDDIHLSGYMINSTPVPSLPLLAAPANGAVNQPLMTTVRWHPSYGATSYTLQMATDSLFGAKVVDDSTLTDTSRQVSGLVHSTLYFWRVLAKNGSGSSPFTAAWSFRTAPAIPTAPLLLFPANGALNQPTDITLSWRTVQFAGTYHIQVSGDSLFGTTLSEDSSLVDTMKDVTSLPIGSEVCWRTRAINATGAGPWSTVWRFTVTTQATRHYPVADGWNLVCVPLAVSDMRKEALYPTAVSAAYAFLQSQGYVQRDTLANGIGYWLKFGGAGLVSLTGVPTLHDTIDVEPGWSLIGGVSGAIDTASVIQVPPGILSSPYYGYNGGYTPTDSLRPGVAYWVKSNEAGKLILTMSDIPANGNLESPSKPSLEHGDGGENHRKESNR